MKCAKCQANHIVKGTTVNVVECCTTLNVLSQVCDQHTRQRFDNLKRLQGESTQSAEGCPGAADTDKPTMACLQGTNNLSASAVPHDDSGAVQMQDSPMCNERSPNQPTDGRPKATRAVQIGRSRGRGRHRVSLG